MSIDESYMRRALELAQFQYGRTGLNPSVGCVIVNRDGQVTSEAATGDGGRPHAEQMALASLLSDEAAGATAYVTLEPCHQRSTGEASCSTRLIEAKIKRVVVAARDPHPQGCCGLDRLKQAGIEVKLGVLESEAKAIYQEFFTSVG